MPIIHPITANFEAMSGNWFMLNQEVRDAPINTYEIEKSLEEMRLQQEKAEFGKGSLVQRRRTYGKSRKNIHYWNNN